MRCYCTVLLLFSAYACSAATRRILHQPFFPSTTGPPLQPPSPPPPPTNLPFFQNYPSPPSPPPPYPSAFATWPVNVSSLVVPRSPNPNSASQKLLAFSLAASVSSIFLLILVAFYYHRRPCNVSRHPTANCDGKGFVPKVEALGSPEIFPLPHLHPKPLFHYGEARTNCVSDTGEAVSFDASSVMKVDEDLLSSASEWDFSKRIFIGKENRFEGCYSPESSSTSDGRVCEINCPQKNETIAGRSSSSLSSSLPVPPPPPLLPLNGSTVEMENTAEAEKPRLKALHWNKVRAMSDREMVWDQLRSSSFKVDEELIESLFIVNSNSSPGKQFPPVLQPIQENRVLEAKRAQNIFILLRALNVTTEEVFDALMDGNSEALGAELLEGLLKMAPTKDEERRLREFKEGSHGKLGPAERFLKAILEIPHPFKRAEAMLYISNFATENEYLKDSFRTLELACAELRGSGMILKVLDTVLKTGNRMNVGTNRGDADSFKLDTLLKLVEIKGVDRKTTLLHFVVQEVIRSEGDQAVQGLSDELGHVKMAAGMDLEVLSGEVVKLLKGIEEIREGAKLMDEEGGKFWESINRFMECAEKEINMIEKQERAAMGLVKDITEYFHGNLAKEEGHPFRIFTVVRDFLRILERVYREIVSSAHKFPVDLHPQHFDVY